MALCLLVLLTVGLALGTGLYFYQNPSRLKGLIQEAAGRTTQSTVTIKDLSYTLRPLKIRVQGITLKPNDPNAGFHFQISQVTADASLQGPFGARTLVLERVGIDDFTLTVSNVPPIPQIDRGARKPSLLIHALRGLFGFFLFKEVKLKAAVVGGGSVTLKWADQILHVKEIRGGINPERLLEVDCTAAWAWPSEGARLTLPRLRFLTDKALSLESLEISGRMTAENGRLQGPEAEVRRISLSAALRYSHNKGALALAPLSLVLQGIRSERHEATLEGFSLSGSIAFRRKDGQITLDDFSLNLQGLRSYSAVAPLAKPLDIQLAAQGEVILRDKTFQCAPFHLKVNDFLSLSGDLHARFRDRPVLALRITEGRFVPQDLLDRLPDEMKRPLAPLSLSGPVKVGGEIGGTQEGQVWRWGCRLHTHLAKNAFSYSTRGLRFHSILSGKILAEGVLPHLSLSLTMTALETRFLGKGVKLRPSAFQLSLSGSYPRFDIRNFSGHAPMVEVGIGGKQIPVNDIRVRIPEGRLNWETRSLKLPHIRLDTSLLKNLHTSLDYNQREATCTLSGKEIQLVPFAAQMDLFPPGWQFQGKDDLRLSVTLREGRFFTFESAVALTGYAFQDRAGAFMGEKVGIRLDMRGQGDLTKSLIHARASLGIEEGEALFDRFYVDLRKNPFSASAGLEADLSSGVLHLPEMSLMLKDVVNLHLTGDMAPQGSKRRIRLSLAMPETPLKPLFRHFLSDPFKTQRPFLGLLQVDGTVSADLDLLSEGDRLEAKGYGKLHKGMVSSGAEGLSARGIDLKLPLWYRTGGEREDQEDLKGRIRVASLTAPLLPEQPLSLDLKARPNALSVSSRTDLKVPGGMVSVGPIRATGLTGARATVETSLHVGHMELKPLLSQIWTAPPEGALTGRLDPIRIENGRMSASGEITADLFDGKIIVSNLGASGISDLSPVIQLSARLRGLNLEQATRGTAFGKVEGIMDGYIKELEIAYGQPQRFDLRLETVKREGVRQRISQKAVDSISQIGGGHSAFIGLAGRFVSFFEEFPYRKIGIRSTLINDVFKINGTVKEDGKEYLVKSGGIPAVNVVNENPDNRISFKDMIKRIKRVTASKGGPVIK